MPDARSQARRLQQGDHLTSTALLARRDVVLTPFAIVALAATMFAGGQLLRSPDAFHPAAAIGAAVLGVIATTATGAAWRLWGRARVSWPVGLATVLLAILGAAILGIAVLDGGLQSPALVSIALVASYMALVLPARWARAGVATVAAGPIAFWLVAGGPLDIDAALIVVLAAGGYGIGRLPRLGHRRSEQRAAELARASTLTPTLNRRGFFEEASAMLGRRGTGAVSLMVVDLDDFKAHNDRFGHDAGDDLLVWTAATIGDLLPDDASLGRIGGDEFAIVLPGLDALASYALAASIRLALEARTSATVGLAVGVAGRTELAELLRAAGDAVRDAKVVGKGCVRVATPPPAPRISAAATAVPVLLPYSAVRHGRRGSREAVNDHARTNAGALFVAAALGAVVVAAISRSGADGYWMDAMHRVAAPWIVGIVGLGLFRRRHPFDAERPTAAAVTIFGAAMLISIGAGVAALATGDGVASPLMAAMGLKIFYDGSVLPPRIAARSTAVVVGGALVVAVLGPVDVRWAAPLVVVLLLGSFALGAVARRTLMAATNAQHDIAMTDPLTGLLNRRAFRDHAESVVAKGPAAGGVVVALDLDEFKRVNERYGYAAGDELLCNVGTALRASLGPGWRVARCGGDEFRAVATGVPMSRIPALMETVDAALRVVAPASVGVATVGPDGVSLDQLLHVADQRSYDAKARRRAAAAA